MPTGDYHYPHVLDDRTVHQGTHFNYPNNYPTHLYQPGPPTHLYQPVQAPLPFHPQLISPLPPGWRPVGVGPDSWPGILTPSPPDYLPPLEPSTEDEAIQSFAELLERIEKLKDGAPAYDDFEEMIIAALRANGMRPSKELEEGRSRYERLLEEEDVV